MRPSPRIACEKTPDLYAYLTIVFEDIGSTQRFKQSFAALQSLGVKILIVLDGSVPSEIKAFCEENCCSIITVPSQSNLAEKRATVLSMIDTPYLLFWNIFWSVPSAIMIQKTINYMILHPKVGILCGVVSQNKGRHNVKAGEQSIEKYLIYDNQRKTLLAIPVSVLGAVAERFQEIFVYQCDVGDSLMILRKQLFDDHIFWDHLVDSAYLNLDLFLQLRKSMAWQVCYTQALTVLNDKSAEKSEISNNAKQWLSFANKWGIDLFEDFGHRRYQRGNFPNAVWCESRFNESNVNEERSYLRIAEDGKIFAREPITIANQLEKKHIDRSERQFSKYRFNGGHLMWKLVWPILKLEYKLRIFLIKGKI